MKNPKNLEDIYIKDKELRKDLKIFRELFGDKHADDLIKKFQSESGYNESTPVNI